MVATTMATAGTAKMSVPGTGLYVFWLLAMVASEICWKCGNGAGSSAAVV